MRELAPPKQTIPHRIPEDVIYGVQLGFLFFRNNLFSDNSVSHEDHNFILNMKKSKSKNHILSFSACPLRLYGLGICHNERSVV
jgi:hypothetical protein